jgi:hypothetical protein
MLPAKQFYGPILHPFSTNWPSTHFPKAANWLRHLHMLLKRSAGLPTLFGVKHGRKTDILAKWQNFNL